MSVIFAMDQLVNGKYDRHFGFKVRGPVHNQIATLIGYVPEVGGWVKGLADKRDNLVKKTCHLSKKIVPPTCPPFCFRKWWFWVMFNSHNNAIAIFVLSSTGLKISILLHQILGTYLK